MSQAEPVVFWDVDGTIVPPSMERSFLRYLLENGIITRGRVVREMLAGGIESFPPRWYKIKVGYLRGMAVNEVNRYIDSWWNEKMAETVYDGSRKAIALLQNNGIRQVLLTGTLRQLATKLGGDLHIEDTLAGEPEIRDNRFTGGLVAPQPKGRRKFRTIERWLKEHNGAWGQTAVIADHWYDRFSMQRAACAVAVRPEMRLARLAKKLRWSVVDQPAEAKAFDEVCTAVVRVIQN